MYSDKGIVDFDDEFAIMAQVDSGTPAGELLRRYWQPLCPASAITSNAPLVKVKVLGESLIVFPIAGGQYAAIGEHCPHRGASLQYGYVEPTGIRCAYHGWLFAPSGQCIERPFEPCPALQKAVTYPVVEMSQLLFTYMGPPGTMTALPRWDMLSRTDGRHRIELQDDLRCNWLQAQENSADVTHTYYLHSRRFAELGIPDESGYHLPMSGYGFQPFEWGVLKSWSYREPETGRSLEGWGSPLVFPNMLHIEREIHWRVPVDDKTTRIVIVGFEPDSPAGPGCDVVLQPPRTLGDGTYHLRTFFSQDSMAWETQGEIANRSREHLGSSDEGVRMFRQMILEQIALVEAGGTPMATVPVDRQEEVISMREWMGGYLPMSAPRDLTPVRRRSRDEVFDDRHHSVVLPNTSPSRDARRA